METLIKSQVIECETVDGGGILVALGNDRFAKDFEEFADNDSEWNFRHRYDLMRAELAAVDGDNEIAITAYQASIDNARKHAFSNDLALATERMGLFFLNNGNLTEASNYLKQSAQLYEAWGSIRKADHVMKKMPRVRRDL